MTDHIQTGLLGEDVASKYLASINFSVLERNIRMQFGEIDIVARDPKGVLVFVEVKTLNSPASLSPEDNLTRAKFTKLSRACSAYANAHPGLVDNTIGWRIDLVAIVVSPTLPVAPGASLFSFGKNNFAVSRYENISSVFV